MIQKDYDEWYIICDNCEERSTAFDSFNEAVDGKQEAGFTSRKIDGQWADICDECSEIKEEV